MDTLRSEPVWWIGGTLLLFLVIMDRYGNRLRRVEADRISKEEKEAMLGRIAFLEEELRSIRGSVPFQIFNGNGKLKTGT